VVDGDYTDQHLVQNDQPIIEKRAPSMLLSYFDKIMDVVETDYSCRTILENKPNGDYIHLITLSNE
jgi:hypothetical protein